MDILSSIINNISPAVSSGSAGSDGNLPKQFFSQLSNFLSQQNFSSGNNAHSFSNINGKPVLTVSGNVEQTATGNSKPISFTSNIPLSKNISGDINSSQNLTYTRGASQEVNLTGQNRPNLLNLSAYTNKLNVDISNIAGSVTGANNAKLDGVTSYNLTAKSITYPSGKLVDLTTQIPQTQASKPTSQIISGRVEFSAQNNETVLFTKAGNFRVAGELSVPNGSTLNFVINSISNIKPEAQINEGLNLNLSSVKIALEGGGSQLQSLLGSLTELPHGNSILSKLFPNLGDKQSFSRALWFLGGSNVGSADQWLGNEGKSFIKANFQNSEQIFKGLNEVFSLLKSLNTNTQTTNSPDSWNTYLLPFYSDSKLEFASFYVQPREQGKKQNSPQDRKFIVELEQENTGQIVIEGMFTEKENKVLNLNLLISSQKGFDINLAEEIEVLFSDISQAYGFNGNIQFINNIPSDYNSVLNQTKSDGIVI